VYFQHSTEIWRDFPELVPGVVFAEGISDDAYVGGPVSRFNAIAESRRESSPRSRPGGASSRRWG
jgi:hypothetical protein